MENDLSKLYELIKNIKITEENRSVINEIKEDIQNQNYTQALKKIEQLNNLNTKEDTNDNKQENNTDDEVEEGKVYPKKLSNPELEQIYIGLLLSNPQQIVKFYFIFEDCFFEDDKLKSELKKKVKETTYNMEKVYVELKKLFVLRKNYLAIPIKNIQNAVVEIITYKLYDKMSIEEVENAVVQVNDTEKFKRAVISEGLTNFLELGENNLTNGLPLPFPILTEVFKGIRKGETMAFAMPSNSGKSRFTIDIAAHVSLVYKKKVLIISNEMSEEKMRLCLITTILNNKEIQKVHGQEVSVTEGELLEFKFRPDESKKVKVDEQGYAIKEDGELQQDFAKRLLEISSDFRKIISVTDWINKQIDNSIYFINITDHTNDELKKVIMNYYYKEQIEYVFYDTLKTDTANIGIGEELKKTATILSNLAQNFGMYICSTLQLAESNTLPVNLNVNDLAVSRTVKEVLDTLCLIKQIHRDSLKDYEYSLNEVDTKFFDLEEYENPDVRYYACVVDKNRAGAKPTLVFRLNLAYNVWNELGYLRLKQDAKKKDK